MHFLKWNLKNLIILVALTSFIISVASNVISSYRMTTSILTENTLNTNEVYAEKLALTTDMYVEQLFQNLSYSANLIGQDITNQTVMDQQVHQLQEQEDTFNSVILVNDQSTIIANAPDSINLIGESLVSPALIEGYKLRKPNITKPFVSPTTKRLVMLLTTPIFDPNGKFVGMIGGAIYLNKENVFEKLLSAHYYNDSSYVYVVDRDGTIIYHPDPERVNVSIIENPVVQKVLSGKSGSEVITNLLNVEMITGYAYAKNAQFGIVAQRPKEVTLAPARFMIKKIILDTIPYLLVALMVIFLGASRISKPLQQLATYVSTGNFQEGINNINKINGWYFEALQLKNSVIGSMAKLHAKLDLLKDQTTLDPLTGLFNRRAMDKYIEEWLENKIPFCMVMLDIDHFKIVNDTFGHVVGDEVINFLSQQMKAVTREDDICCRYGGEEFVILLPNTTLAFANVVTERLRVTMENTIAPHGNNITISAGVVCSDEEVSTASSLIHIADVRLYKAKKNGRNQVVANSN